MIDKKELPKEDLNLIAQIDARLKHYNLIAPIEQVEEVEYKIMLSDCGLNTTKGKIYECYYQKGEDAYTIIDDLGNRNRGWDVGCFSHSKSTREAYLSQQEQPKWKVGEFVLSGTSIGYVTQVMNDRVLATNLDGNWAMNVEFSKAQNPTKEQVEQQLTKIAIEKYKIGYIVDDGISRLKLTSLDCYLNNKLYAKSICINPSVRRNGGEHEMDTEIWSIENGWADFKPETPKSIVKEEVKERWKPTICGIEYWIINSGFEPKPWIYLNNEYDVTFTAAGNCFKTEEEAQSAATQIKALLATI